MVVWRLDLPGILRPSHPFRSSSPIRLPLDVPPRPVPYRGVQSRQETSFRDDHRFAKVLLASSRKASPSPGLHTLRREGWTRLPSQGRISKSIVARWSCGDWVYPEYSALLTHSGRAHSSGYRWMYLLAQCRTEEAKAAKRRPMTNSFPRAPWWLPRARPLRRHRSAHASTRRLDAPSLATHRLPPPQRRYHRFAQRPPALPPPQDAPQYVPRHGKICPNHRNIEKCPTELLSRQRFGDLEMDCVVSGHTGKGGASSSCSNATPVTSQSTPCAPSANASSTAPPPPHRRRHPLPTLTTD